MFRNLMFSKKILVLAVSLTAGSLAYAQAAPQRWSYTAVPSITAIGTPSFGGWPTICVPAVAGVRRVIDCVSITYGTVGTATSQYRTILLEDGASGGTPLMRWGITPSQSNSQIPTQIHLCGLNLPATAGNAVTLRITNGGSNNSYNNYEYATLNLVGYNAQ